MSRDQQRYRKIYPYHKRKKRLDTVTTTNLVNPNEWIRVGFSDTSSFSGLYTFSHSAGSTLDHSITIDDSSDDDAAYFKSSTSASVYYDTGLSPADFVDYGAVLINVRMETTVDSTADLFDDLDTDLNFGVFASNNQRPSGSTAGLYGGLMRVGIGAGSFQYRIFSSKVGRFTTDANASSSGAVLFGYDGLNDTLKGVNLNCLGVSRGTSASPSFGLSRGNITGYYLDSSNSNVLTTDQGGYSTNSDAVSEQTFTSGNLHIGAIFNVNKIGGSGVTKSLEFNLFYQISRLTLT